jgi:3,5-epimerase/4-reductase
MNIMTIGAGFVADHLPYENINQRVALNIAEIRFILTYYKPDVLINCIGKTGRPNVDWCETNKEETANANTLLPIMLAEECAKKSIHLIQISSGCIYFGKSPHFHWLQGDGTPWPERIEGSFVIPGIKVEDGWREDDFANPKSFYSKTKYACDLILGQMPHVTTLRIRMPVSTKNNSRNLINKLRGYKQIINIPNSMTFMDDLVKCIGWVAKEGRKGIYHVTNPQPLTAVRIMQEYQKHVPKHTFDILYNEEQLDKLTIAKRSNCILDSQKLNLAGFYMTPSEDALSECMQKYIKNIDGR